MSDEARKWIITHMIYNIRSMFLNAIKALPVGAVIAVAVFLYICFYEKRKGIKIKRSRKRNMILFATYLAMVFDIVIFSRPIGSMHVIDLIPFDTYGGARYIVLYATANAVIFIPLGFLVPQIWRRLQSLKACLILGFLVSLFIESTQLILCCGVVQTEDLIMNTIGAGIGYWIYKKWCAKRRK